MIKVKVKNRLGLTTSVVAHRNGTYPVWFKKSKNVEFIDSSEIIFIKR